MHVVLDYYEKIKFFNGGNVYNANFVLLNSLGNLARIFLKMVNSVLT